MLWAPLCGANKESVCKHCKLYRKLDWQNMILCVFSHLGMWWMVNQIKWEEELWQSEQFCANSKRRQSPPMVNHHQPAQFYQQHHYWLKRCGAYWLLEIHQYMSNVMMWRKKQKVAGENFSKHEELGQNALERSASWSWLGQNAWNVFSYEENRMFLRLGCLLLFSRNWKENRNCKMFWL